MESLYIIGNGFDRHHGLPTGYCNFHEYIINNRTDLENLFEEYFAFTIDEKKNLWSSFEKDLETFDYKSFFDENRHIDIQDKNFKRSSTYCIEDDLTQETEELIKQIRDAFENWIEDINLDSVEEKLKLEKNALFLNFNYTQTLEKVYGISSNKIFHIHGDIERIKSNLIFGHNKTIEEEIELDENGDSNRTPFSDSENISKYPFYNLYKPVYDIIKENQLYFEELKSVKDIFILGHGLDSIDIPYFKEIIKHIKKNIVWNVTYNNLDEKEKHNLTLQKIGIDKSLIKMFEISKLNKTALDILYEIPPSSE